MSKPLICAMCGKLAEFISKDTKEPLCKKCAINNEEARNKK